ncbi:hypothetical protein FHX36_000426 [Modestobacter versicolor]|uniref:Uncharacterized protein n=1 Tax=Modestobacter versicolor TaxID=429133 RepID=A0A839Y271_9ACTN|nr:hypothetical protein [Modestobacter versicolor]
MGRRAGVVEGGRTAGTYLVGVYAAFVVALTLLPLLSPVDVVCVGWSLRRTHSMFSSAFRVEFEVHAVRRPRERVRSRPGGGKWLDGSGRALLPSRRPCRRTRRWYP